MTGTAMPTETPTFLVVTPTFQSAQFLDETILSVLSQHGGFRIRYHVQDGGSSDETVRKLGRWKAALEGGHFPILCAGVEFTFDSAKDRGMYDAINRGFERLGVRDGDYLTYINADDRLLPGALQFAAGRFGEAGGIDWLGGRPCEMNEAGEMMRIHDEQAYPLATLRAGLHDGRFLSFVMQEGTFWRGSLWKQSGGFRTELRQAGDWDLWRRFAHHAPYFSTDMVLACHRRSAKQLTADKGVYYREVDGVIAQEIGELHRAEWERYQAWLRTPDPAGWFHGPVLKFQASERHGGRGEWQANDRSCRVALKNSVSVTNGLTGTMLPAIFEAGFGPESTSEVSLGLLPGWRQTAGAECGLRFEARREALHRIFLRCRNFDNGTALRMVHRGRTILNVELPMTSHDRDCLVIAEAVFQVGDNRVALTIAGNDSGKTPVLAVVSCEAMCTV